MSSVYSLDLGKNGSLETRTTDSYSEDGRPIFAYYVVDGAGNILQEGHDLKGSVGGNQEAEEMMASLLSFLGACAEASGPESDNWDLFNEATREWAKANAAEIAITENELESATLAL